MLLRENPLILGSGTYVVKVFRFGISLCVCHQSNGSQPHHYIVYQLKLQGGTKKVRKTFVLYSVSFMIHSMKFGLHMAQHHEIKLVKYGGPCDLSFGVM